MPKVLSKVFTTEVGEVYLTDTLEQCKERVANSGLQNNIEEKSYDETWIIIGDYKNLSANCVICYKNNTLKLVDFCDSNIEYLELSDGTRYSYDKYRELMKENIEKIKCCRMIEEQIPQSKAIETCSWKKCDSCKYGSFEKYVLTDTELGYELHYDNVYNDSGFKCLRKII